MTAQTNVTLTVDGQPVRVPAGRTVAAALMLDAEQLAWRTTRFEGRRRGLFCGIGVCFDCLVCIDEQPALRACLVQVREGMVVQTQEDPPPGSPADPAGQSEAPGARSARTGNTAVVASGVCGKQGESGADDE